MRHTRPALLLFGAFTMLSIGSCKKDSEDPAPPTGNGPNPPAACQFGTSVTDIDGNEYPVVIIGNQQWMAENLRTTRYRDGSAIPNVTDYTEWGELTSAAWCNYDNDPAATYGKLYNWYAAGNPDICPQGWHVPTNAEWTQLADHLGGWVVAGGKLKTTNLWAAAPNVVSTNATCFSGVPSGYRAEVYITTFETGFRDGGIGEWGPLWSSTVSGTEHAYLRTLVYGNNGIHDGVAPWKNGYCVRCLMD